jgi:hypothetical protein
VVFEHVPYADTCHEGKVLSSDLHLSVS